jgi:hypothetical protein
MWGFYKDFKYFEDFSREIEVFSRIKRRFKYRGFFRNVSMAFIKPIAMEDFWPQSAPVQVDFMLLCK